MRRYLVVSALLALPAYAADEPMLNRAIDEALNQSEIPDTASYLTDHIGGRMTNSPQMRMAEKWTQERFKAWGLSNVRAEAFDFGRGWSIERVEARMVEPRIVVMHAIPIAWTPSTKGTVKAPVIVAPIRREADFAKWKGKLKGKVVMADLPGDGSEPDRAPFRRYENSDFERMDDYVQPRFSESDLARTLRRGNFALKLDAFLNSEGALVVLRQSTRDGGLLHGNGYGYRVGQTPKVAGIELAAEDYRRLARLSKSSSPPVVELTSVVRYHDEDRKAYNIIAEIPGSDPKAGY
ncbi:MAG TPA: hypothetical protein VK629_18425, partial [Steroidobacteraceae bacterium]|nr:hypothetical protein [Steroidobacteraceae bacterium]